MTVPSKDLRWKVGADKSASLDAVEKEALDLARSITYAGQTLEQLAFMLEPYPKKIAEVRALFKREWEAWVAIRDEVIRRARAGNHAAQYAATQIPAMVKAWSAAATALEKTVRDIEKARPKKEA